MSEEVEVQQLKTELLGLFKYVQRVREEIAAMALPTDEDNQFGTMGEQLDIIITATEDATNTIMEVVEKNDVIVDGLMKKFEGDAETTAMLNDIVNNNMEVIQACSFQDLTGQRVSRVIKSISYVETRVLNLTDIWGKEELEKVELEAVEKTEDEKLLHGPQDPGRGISQDEIDSLFD